MHPKTFFPSFFIAFTVLICQIELFAEASKTQALEKLRTGLKYVTNQVDIQDANFSVLQEDQNGIQLSGVASVFGLSNVNVQATISDTQHSFSLAFPSGASYQLQIGDQNLSSWLPSFLQDKLDLTTIEMSVFPKESNRVVLSASLSQPNAGSLIDYNGLKISQPVLQFSLSKINGANSQTQATAGLNGNLQLAGLNFDLAATANTSKEWTIAATLNQMKVSDLVKNIATFMRLFFLGCNRYINT